MDPVSTPSLGKTCSFVRSDSRSENLGQRYVAAVPVSAPWQPPPQFVAHQASHRIRSGDGDARPCQPEIERCLAGVGVVPDRVAVRAESALGVVSNQGDVGQQFALVHGHVLRVRMARRRTGADPRTLLAGDPWRRHAEWRGPMALISGSLSVHKTGKEPTDIACGEVRAAGHQILAGGVASARGGQDGSAGRHLPGTEVRCLRGTLLVLALLFLVTLLFDG